MAYSWHISLIKFVHLTAAERVRLIDEWCIPAELQFQVAIAAWGVDKRAELVTGMLLLTSSV